MNADWLIRRLGWLALALGAVAFTLWMAHAAVAPAAPVGHYYPRGTI